MIGDDRGSRIDPNHVQRTAEFAFDIHPVQWDRSAGECQAGAQKHEALIHGIAPPDGPGPPGLLRQRGARAQRVIGRFINARKQPQPWGRDQPPDENSIADRRATTSQQRRNCHPPQRPI
jgi:hypothetical protein